jgi:hypothetical protein
MPRTQHLHACIRFGTHDGVVRAVPLVKPENLSDDAPVDPVRVKLLADGVEPAEVLMVNGQGLVDITHVNGQRVLTSGSRFLAARVIISRLFFVQCGRHGNSSMRVCARLASFPAKLASPLPSSRLMYILTERLVEAQMVASCGPVRRKVKHDGPLAPVRSIRRIVSNLAEEIVVGLANYRLQELAYDLRSMGHPKK